MTKYEIDQLTYKIIGAAIEVHKMVGPGLIESVYHKCMKKELALRGLAYNSELVIDFEYKGEAIETGLRCDLLIEDSIVVELKALDVVHPIHEAKLLTYMKLLGKPKGIMINFTCDNIFRCGQKTFVNNLYRELA